MLRGDQEQGVGVVRGGAQGRCGGGDLAFDVDVLVVERDVAEGFVDDHVNVLRGVQLDGFGELLVGGIGAEAADQGEDGVLGHVYSWVSRRG